MIEDADLSDEAWVEFWVKRQRERLSLIDRCIAAKSLRPFATDLFERAKAVYQAVRNHRDAAVSRQEYAVTAHELGQKLGNRQLLQLAASAAKAQESQVEAAEHLLDVAIAAAGHDVARAARLLAKEPDEPVYSRSNPQPGVPAWYYPEEKGSTDVR
jgi:hypothetical protein